MRLVCYQNLLNVEKLLYRHLENRGWNHGFDLSLQQLKGVCASFEDNCSSTTILSNQQKIRLVVRMNPKSADDVAQQFDGLDTMMNTEAFFASSAAVDLDLVVVRRPPELEVACIQSIVDYLYQVLPHGAKFLEAHSSIGSFNKHGQCNAHGNPMDRHVIGVCHDLNLVNHNILAEVVDVLPPTRFSVALASGSVVSPLLENDLGWEGMQQSTDHFDFGDAALLSTQNSTTNTISLDFCRRVWKWQAEVAKARETYVSCSSEVAAQRLFTFYNDNF